MAAASKTLIPKLMVSEIEGLRRGLAIFEVHVGRKIFSRDNVLSPINETTVTGVFDGYMNAMAALITEIKNRVESVDGLMKEGGHSR